MEFNKQKELSIYKFLCSLESTTYEVRIEALENLDKLANKANFNDKIEIRAFVSKELKSIKKQLEEDADRKLADKIIDSKYETFLLQEYTVDSEYFSQLKKTFKEAVDSLINDTSDSSNKYNKIRQTTNIFMEQAQILSNNLPINANKFNAAILLLAEVEKIEQLLINKFVKTSEVNSIVIQAFDEVQVKIRSKILGTIKSNIKQAIFHQKIQGIKQNEIGNGGNNGRGGTKMPQKQLPNPIAAQTKPVLGQLTQVFSGPKKQIERQIQ